MLAEDELRDAVLLVFANKQVSNFHLSSNFFVSLLKTYLIIWVKKVTHL